MIVSVQHLLLWESNLGNCSQDVSYLHSILTLKWYIKLYNSVKLHTANSYSVTEHTAHT